jgi:hypothetical protein
MAPTIYRLGHAPPTVTGFENVLPFSILTGRVLQDPHQCVALELGATE